MNSVEKSVPALHSLCLKRNLLLDISWLFTVLYYFLQVIALKHHTSKLADFPDLQSLATFGFRGEALSSLCALGDLTVETRTKNEPVATHLTFDHSGLLTAETKTARQIGTTVTVKKLFCNLPVRSKEFRRNIRKEYGKLISLLNVSEPFLSFCSIFCHYLWKCIPLWGNDKPHDFDYMNTP